MHKPSEVMPHESGPPMRDRARRAGDFARSGRSVGFATLLVLGSLSIGCQPGLRWRLGTYADAHTEAAREQKLTFVYFRNWYSVDCTNFEERILKHSDVRAKTQQMVCVPLEYDYDRGLAERWELDVVPSFAIVDPEGRVLARGQAPLTRDEVLTAMRDALDRFQRGSGAAAH